MSAEHAAIARPFAPADVAPLLERNGIEAAIVVQGACLDSDTDYLLEEAARTDWIAALTAWVSLEDPDRATRRLDELERSPKLRGVRHLSHGEPDDWLLRAPVLESVAMLAERELILEVPVVFPRHFDDVVSLAERFPRLRIVIDHLGKPPLGSSRMARWERELRDAAEHPNVLAKVSGLTSELGQGWGAEDLRPAVEIAFECFGPERLMAGSDWPVALLNGDYDRTWQATAAAIAATAPDASSLLLGENARRIYRLESRSTTC